MTPEEKITALVEHIKKEFPNGCRGVACDKCTVYKAGSRTTEGAVCHLLESLCR